MNSERTGQDKIANGRIKDKTKFISQDKNHQIIMLTKILIIKYHVENCKTIHFTDINQALSKYLR